MKKLILIIILLFTAIAGVWFGYNEYKRSSLLKSGENLLLINKDAGIFSYSDEFSVDNVDRSWTVVGKVSDYSSDQLASRTKGYSYFVQEFVGGETINDTVQIPTELEMTPWNNLLSNLSQSQLNRCQAIESQSYSQQCLIRHITYTAVQQQLGTEYCDGIFIEEYKEQCKEDVIKGELADFRDSNNNEVLDMFEPYTPPSNSDSFSEAPGVIN